VTADTFSDNLLDLFCYTVDRVRNINFCLIYLAHFLFFGIIIWFGCIWFVFLSVL